MSGIYVYGFTRPDAPVRVNPAGPAVFLHALKEVAALATEIAEEAADPRRLLLAHHQVLATVLQDTTVIPLRAGVLLDSVQQLSELVAREYKRVGRLLQAFDDRVEANVKAFYREETILQEIVDENPRLVTVGENYVARARTGQRVAEMLERRRTRDGRDLLAVLTGHAERIAVHSASDFTAANISCLLRRDLMPEFEATLSAWGDAQRQRLRVVYIAPLPPYSFVG